MREIKNEKELERYQTLDTYEKSIVDVLTKKFFYSFKESISIVTGYRDVMKRIGSFENPKDWATKLDEAMKYHITPDMWLQIL